MGSFSELIKNFDKTRDYVRDFFIYGFKVRNDFDRKSARTYDDERRRVESWLGDYLRYAATERGKQAAITVDSGQIAENPLYRALAARSFTDNDIRLHFLLLDLLSDGRAYGIRALTERLNTDYGALFDEQTVRGKLREYAAEGILLTERMGKSVLYRLSPDTPQALFASYEGLSDAVKFFSCLPEFGFAGHTLLKAAGLNNDIFLMKHNYIVHTLEDTVLLALTDAIHKGHRVRLHYFSKRRNSVETVCIPLQIYASAQTGRRYLMFYHPQLHRLCSYRLDYIRRAEDDGVCENYAEYAEILRRNADKSFGVCFGERHGTSRESTVRITMRIDMEQEAYILERLEREKRCGTVTQLDAEHIVCTMTLFDPTEIMGWLKTYIGRIVSIEGAPQEEAHFQRDVERMQEMYNGKEHSDAAVQ